MDFGIFKRAVPDFFQLFGQLDLLQFDSLERPVLNPPQALRQFPPQVRFPVPRQSHPAAELPVPLP